MATLTTLSAKLDALDDDFSIFAAKAPTEARIDTLEKKLGLALHPEHRVLIAKTAACAVIADEKVWPRPKAFEIRPAWQFCLGLEIFGLVPKSVADKAKMKQQPTRGKAKPGADSDAWVPKLRDGEYSDRRKAAEQLMKEPVAVRKAVVAQIQRSSRPAATRSR